MRYKVGDLFERHNYFAKIRGLMPAVEDKDCRYKVSVKLKDGPPNSKWKSVGYYSPKIFEEKGFKFVSSRPKVDLTFK